MIGLVEAVRRHVSRCCIAACCQDELGKCTLSMDGVPSSHVLVDLDCRQLELSDTKRCDFLFVGEVDTAAWVAPIELKSGAFDGLSAAQQLQGGADAAGKWIRVANELDFVPILAHRPSRGRRRRFQELRSSKITFGDRTRQPIVIRCGDSLMKSLSPSGHDTRPSDAEKRV